jgi:hypothetical protein
VGASSRASRGLANLLVRREAPERSVSQVSEALPVEGPGADFTLSSHAHQVELDNCTPAVSLTSEERAAACPSWRGEADAWMGGAYSRGAGGGALPPSRGPRDTPRARAVQWIARSILQPRVAEFRESDAVRRMHRCPISITHRLASTAQNIRRIAAFVQRDGKLPVPLVSCRGVARAAPLTRRGVAQ